jgi:hypothetical protein
MFVLETDLEYKETHLRRRIREAILKYVPRKHFDSWQVLNRKDIELLMKHDVIDDLFLDKIAEAGNNTSGAILGYNVFRQPNISDYITSDQIHEDIDKLLGIDKAKFKKPEYPNLNEIVKEGVLKYLKDEYVVNPYAIKSFRPEDKILINAMIDEGYVDIPSIEDSLAKGVILRAKHDIVTLQKINAECSEELGSHYKHMYPEHNLKIEYIEFALKSKALTKDEVVILYDNGFFNKRYDNGFFNESPKTTNPNHDLISGLRNQLCCVNYEGLTSLTAALKEVIKAKD